MTNDLVNYPRKLGFNLVALTILSSCATAPTTSAAPSIPTVDNTNPAIAQWSPRLDALLALPQHRMAVLAAVKLSGTWVKHGCQNASFTPIRGARLWIYPEFSAAGIPIVGQWRESVLAQGCGLTRVLNATTTVTGSNVAQTMPGVPGVSRGNPTLQIDGWKYAQLAVRATLPECMHIYLDDTALLTTLVSTGVPGARWSEKWTVVACGKPLFVEMTFDPQTVGAVIGAHVTANS